MRSVQEASPQTAKAFIEVMEASVFGTVAPAHAPIVGTGTPQSGAAATPSGARASPSSPGDTTPQTPVTPVGVGAHQSGGGAYSSGGASHRTPVGYDVDPSSPQEGSSSEKNRNKFVRDDTIENWVGGPEIAIVGSLWWVWVANKNTVLAAHCARFASREMSD